jgi:tetrahydromethanopterin S-methyltransferase subunit G
MEKQEFNELLSAISIMMDSKLEPINKRLDGIEQRLDKVELTLENETNKNIKLLAEGHVDVVNRLDKLERKVEDIEDTVSVLKVLTKSLQTKQ